MNLVVNITQPVSKHFILGDLIKTNTGLLNMPNPTQVENMKKYLGPVLDRLYDKFGPFIIHSAFRSKEVQGEVNPENDKTSFHELGLAIDITPAGMSTKDYFAKILADPTTLNMMGEFSLKPSQNAIHLSAKVPGVQTKIMEMNTSGSYNLMSAEKIAGLLSEHQGKISAGIGGILLFLGGLFLAIKKKRKNG